MLWVKFSVTGVVCGIITTFLDRHLLHINFAGVNGLEQIGHKVMYAALGAGLTLLVQQHRKK